MSLLGSLEKCVLCGLIPTRYYVARVSADRSGIDQGWSCGCGKRPDVLQVNESQYPRYGGPQPEPTATP